MQPFRVVVNYPVTEGNDNIKYETTKESGGAFFFPPKGKAISTYSSSPQFPTSTDSYVCLRRSELSPNLLSEDKKILCVQSSMSQKRKVLPPTTIHSHNNPLLFNASTPSRKRELVSKSPPIIMSAKPLLYTISSAAIGGFVELTYGKSLVSAHGSQIAAFTPAVLIGTGFWALMHGFEVGKARTKYAELAKKDGEGEVDERYSLP